MMSPPKFQSTQFPFLRAEAQPISALTWLVRRTLLLGVLLCGVFLLPEMVEGQCTTPDIPENCSIGRGPYTANVRGTVRLTVTPPALNLGSPTFTDFSQGYSEAGGQAVEIRSNNDWELYIRSSQATWNGTGGGRANKPRSDLQWSLDSDGSFAGLTGNNVASNVLVSAGTATSSQLVDLYYRVLWSWELDRSGTYTLPVVFTLSAP